MAFLRGLAAVVGFAGATVAVGACHLVFDGDLGVVRCDRDGAFGPPSCPEDQTCVAGVCSPVGAPLGAACDRDRDCEAPAYCLDPADFGAEGEARCTVACCSASECGRADQGLVCWVPPEAAGAVCWPHTLVDRAPPGERTRGEACDEDDDCRSGRCVDETCFDTCCSDAGCDGAEVCRASNAPDDEGRAWQCGPPPSGADVNQGCLNDSQCRHNLCVPTAIAVMEEEPICVRPCCSSRECGSVQWMDEVFPLACAISDAGVRGCSRVLKPMAKGEVGAPCETGDTCRSGLCIGPTGDKYCSDLCCNDDSCGDVSVFACRPGPADPTWALRCVRR